MIKIVKLKILSYLLLLACIGCSNMLTPEEKERYEKCQEEVSAWIKNYAQYPESYESISFEAYSELVSKQEGVKIHESEVYVLKHVHKILDRDSIMETFTGYFILAHDFSVNIIETSRSNETGRAFPPRVALWMDQFGRPQTAEDCIDLEQKEKNAMARFINEL